MPRVRSVVKHDENPFLTGFQPPTRRRRVTVNANRAVVNTDTGELESAAEIVRFEEVDDDKFVKIYTQNLKAFFSLKPATYRMVEIMLVTLQRTPNTDRVFLNLDLAKKYFEENGEKAISSSAFYNSINEMIEKGFIAQSTIQGMYYINPGLFFNGDRVSFVKEYRRKVAPKAAPQVDSRQLPLIPHE